MGRPLASALCVVAVLHSAAASALPPARVQPWRTSDDVVDGWDWSLPPDVRPAERSGVWFAGTAPPDFPGRRLELVTWSWARLEPDEGARDFEALRREILQAGRGHGRDGVILVVQGSTASTTIVEGGREREIEGTVPAWVLARPGVAVIPAAPRTNLATPFTVSNVDVADPDVQRPYLAMVEALGRSGIPAMPEVRFAVVPGVSGTRGEESGLAARDERTIACMEERLEAWAAAFRGEEWKLAWVGDGEGGSPLLARAYALGMGQRSGLAERYLLHIPAPQLGQVLDADGYLLTEETCPPIAENRSFGDENEEYDRDVHVERYGPPEGWPFRYRESMLRALEMRRNWLWAEADPWVDPPLLGFVSLELGRTVADAPDAWCELRESRLRVGGTERSVKNFERWLRQRDRDGARTEPALPAEFPARGAEEWTARRTDLAGGNGTIGFALDDRFLSGGPHRVAIKVTYADAGDGAWELAVPSRDGETVRTVRCGGTGAVRTATFFLDRAFFPAAGDDFDFVVRAVDEDAVLCLVRVIRLD